MGSPADGSADERRADTSTAAARFVQLASSAGGIYGLIVVSGLIVVTRDLSGSSWEALLAIVGTLLVFFAAHAYAATLSEMSHHRLPFGQALRNGVIESLGMVVVGLAPVLVLLLGVLGVLRPFNAVWLALLLDVFLLGILGWAVSAARLTSPWARLGGAVVAAGFGGLIIALKALLH